jgi:CheY-like chemotaxis protein
MAISKKFVEMMGGHISVKSKLGEGSCFTVELTFDVDETKREATGCDSVVDLHGMKVMLVEDNELNMEIAREILTEEGLVITEAENGKVAVDKFTESPEGTFDAVLMDVMMPVMDGYEATRTIRASGHPQAKTVPIIAMTANAYKEDVEMAKQSGMNDHVPKPIDIELLLHVLEHYYRSAKQQSA